MADLGDIGHNFPDGQNIMASWYPFTYNKQPTSVTMTAVSDIPYAFAALFRNSVENFRTRCDGSGNWAFYDMDDSGSQIYTIATFTQNGPTGELWTASVVGAVVVVTKLFAASRQTAVAFT